MQQPTFPRQQYQQTPYPHQPSYQYPPQVPSPKKCGIGNFFSIGCGSLVALVVIIALALVSCGQSQDTQNAQQAATAMAQDEQHIAQSDNEIATAETQKAHLIATLTAIAAQKWTTTHTFTGNGTKKTAIFTAPADWKINWTCSPNSFYGGEYNVQVFVYGSDGSLVDVAVNTICKAGNTSDSTEEHQGGQVYLDINSEAAWTIQVQELK